MNPTTPTTDRLFAGRVESIKLTDGAPLEVNVRQLSVRAFRDASKLAHDEVALTQFVCGLDDATMDKLPQLEYEKLQAAVKEVNPGFFAHARRLSARQQEAEVLSAQAALERMTPEERQIILAQGMSQLLKKQCARVCLATGLTRAQLLDESIEWLALLADEKARADAERDLKLIQGIAGDAKAFAAVQKMLLCILKQNWR